MNGPFWELCPEERPPKRAIDGAMANSRFFSILAFA